MNVDQRQGQLNALGMAEPLIQAVKLVAPLIVMKPVALAGLIPAPMVAAVVVNVVHLARHTRLQALLPHHQAPAGEIVASTSKEEVATV